MTRPWSAGSWFLLYLAIAGQGADLITTQAALKKDGVEGALLVGPHPPLEILVLYKILLILSFYCLASYSRFNQPLIRNRAFSLLALLGGSAACWNVYIMR